MMEAYIGNVCFTTFLQCGFSILTPLLICTSVCILNLKLTIDVSKWRKHKVLSECDKAVNALLMCVIGLKVLCT